MRIITFLRRLGVFRPFDSREVVDAETENVLRDHNIAMQRVDSSDKGIRTAQGRLLESIKAAITSVPAEPRVPDRIAQFVHDMRSSGQQNHRH